MKDWFARGAATYDSSLGAMGEPSAIEPAVDLLAGLAGGGAALELAIGTGRIALPLAARGVRVAGIELSEPMVEQLRAKPGGTDIDVVIGDMTTARVDGSFAVAYLVYNTIENLTSQDAQVACFENVARHLVPGGCFVIEVAVPQLRRLPPGERFVPFSVTPDHLGIDEYDVAEQGLVSHHYRNRDDAWRQISMPFRYVWPSELDLMARIAGMTLRDRWQDWDRSPFTSESEKHVSVWQKPGPRC
ncbi:MAG TPA: class I SAM-dependent methyltransferase [Gaiellaceae bacterium]|nr:class I SAM-dependent methyltransferase [Gaiellaceae bacterium]